MINNNSSQDFINCFDNQTENSFSNLNYNTKENSFNNTPSVIQKQTDNINLDNPNKNNNQIIEIELKNIQMLILQRSLYILKKKFGLYKKELDFIYKKYKDYNYPNIRCINTKFLPGLYREIMDITQFTLLPYTNFNELLSADLMTELNENKTESILKALVNFTRTNIENYNKLYYEKKMKKIQLQKENEIKKKPELQEEEFTTEVKIEKYDKRGKVIKDFNQMIEENKEFEVEEYEVYMINEDDISVLNNKKLLYCEVIPLIIADFIQNYMQNNINIAIISTLNISNDIENNKLNEEIKSLFDNEIIKFYNSLNKIDPNEEKKEKLKNLLFEQMNIDNQINIYKNLIVEKSKKGVNASSLLNMVNKLTEQRNIIDKKIKQLNNIKDQGNNNNNFLNGLTNTNFSAITTNTNLKNLMISETINYGRKERPLKKIFLKNNKSSFSSINEVNNTNNNTINIVNLKKSRNNRNIKGYFNSNIQSINSNNNINLSNNNEYLYGYVNNSFDNDNLKSGLKKQITKEEIRNNNLLEIFHFYTRQHYLYGKTPTFEQIMSNEKHLDLSEFSKFCIEFKILVKPQKIAEIFKKKAPNSRNMDFNTFLETLKKLSISVNDEKKQYLMERIKLYKMKLKEIKDEEKKNSKNIINQENEKEGICEEHNMNNEEGKNDGEENNFQDDKKSINSKKSKSSDKKINENQKKTIDNNKGKKEIKNSLQKNIKKNISNTIEAVNKNIENNVVNTNKKNNNPNTNNSNKKNDNSNTNNNNPNTNNNKKNVIPNTNNNNNKEKNNPTTNSISKEKNNPNTNNINKKNNNPTTNNISKEKNNSTANNINKENNNSIINNNDEENNNPTSNNINEENNNSNINSNNNKEINENINNNKKETSKKKKKKIVKAKTSCFLIMDSKEEIEDKISKLKQDYDRLNQKTYSQLEEELYQYLEIDDANIYRKKMVGYLIPFSIHDKKSRIPPEMLQIKRDKKSLKEMHKILVQRHEELKKEKELKQIKEKNILFEKRKKQFNEESKKIQLKYNQKIKKDYIQIKKNEDDYLKVKNNKITWQQIQNSDYDTFMLNGKDNQKNNMDDIFTDKSNNFDDDEYLKNLGFLQKYKKENIKVKAK